MRGSNPTEADSLKRTVVTNLKKTFRWIVFFALIAGWVYIDWAVRVEQRQALYRDSRYNIAQGENFFGWAFYNPENGEATFNIGNFTRQPVDFTGANFFIVLNGRTQYDLDLRRLTNVYYSKKTDSLILEPYNGQFGLTVRCDLPVEFIVSPKSKIPPAKIKGFCIVLKDGPKIRFGYEEGLNYLQTIKRFLVIKGILSR
jgi:hypothetical protein